MDAYYRNNKEIGKGWAWCRGLNLYINSS